MASPIRMSPRAVPGPVETGPDKVAGSMRWGAIAWDHDVCQ